MRAYLGIGTTVKDHLGNVGRVIGYDDENKIITIRYPEQKVTRVRDVRDMETEIKVISYRGVE